MAQVVLSAVGGLIGGPIGAAVGGSVGAMIDRAAVASLRPAREVGPRLKTLHVMSAAEGAPVPAVFGRARVAGQVIWAARFTAARTESRTGGKVGARVVEETYALSFAVALGEGPIDGVGRIWADGKPMDMTGVALRVHLGGEHQEPDPLIAAVEGEAPAYRGTAYAVFEDLPLGAYGNRAPQLSFEVFRRPRAPNAVPGLEERLEGVCLIPGAGEFVLGTSPVLRREGLTRARAENVNNTEGRPDLLVSLDQLGAQLPAVKAVTLVVSWFGDDLRAGVCEVRPGVEIAEKETLPLAWAAGGVERSGARVLAGTDGRPAYGGTPADRTVVDAIVELKRRGYSVTLYPFLMMDVRPGNGLVDPYGRAEQPPFPWRGRISCHPAPGRSGSPDGTAAAAAEVEAFFGEARADQFSVVDGEVRFGGSEWSWSRAVLHYARLGEMVGGVDGFLIGSELRGLTSVRDGVSGYPAVRALRRLAGECRKVLRPETALSYAADWSEWFGHQPADGSGHVCFHLDPLWSDPAISFIGLDWYPPGADWRDGDDHLDAQAGYDGPHDPAYLAANVAGGEGFGWFYTSQADRLAQIRTPITDGAHGEPWVFRPKDIASWWSNPHHDRPLGVRSAEPTGWVPGSKPVRLVEFGCPAVDKGANSPNLFYDPKSSENGLPPFSDGGRDDLGQRRAVEAVLAHFDKSENNPVSARYGGPMVDGLSAWCWDARPFPDFPRRPQVWADAPNWTYGHWLNGRAGIAPAAELLAAVLARGGVGPAEVDLNGARGSVVGYVVDRPMSLRDAVAPLLDVFALDFAERDGRITAVARDGPATVVLNDDDLAWPERAEAPQRTSRTLAERPAGARVRFTDDAGDYQVSTVSVTNGIGGRGGWLEVDLPVVMRRVAAERFVERRLQDAEGRAEVSVHPAPEAVLRLEPGDRVRLRSGETAWRVVEVQHDEAPRATLVEIRPTSSRGGGSDEEWRPGARVEFPAPPVLHLLDLPALPTAALSDGAQGDGLLAAVSGDPWRGAVVTAGPSGPLASIRGRAMHPAGVGVTVSVLESGPLHRLHVSGRLTVNLEGAKLQSRSWAEVAAGANALAVLGPSGEWEVLQFLHAELVGPETYVLSRLLRGQAGTDPAMGGTLGAGASVVLLNDDLVRVEVRSEERGVQSLWRAAPPGSVDPVSLTEIEFTWRGLVERPWSPVGLSLKKRPGGDVHIRWTRRARLAGDVWQGEPPLSEDQERYLLTIFGAGAGAVVRSWEVASAEVTYAAAEVAADFPDPSVAVEIEVRQGSGRFGWGAPSRRTFQL